MSARARAIVAALSLLVLGAMLGIAIDRHLLSSRGHGNPALAFHQMTMSSMEERLDLTADQRTRIEEIVAARHNSLSDAWRILHTHLGATVDSVHQEIEAVLNPAQRAEFRAWLQDFR